MSASSDPSASQGATHEIAIDEGLHALVRRFVLVVEEGPDAGLRFTSVGDRTVVGTAEKADLVLSDRSVSKFHCEVVPTGDRLVVRDLGSRNGTLVDGVSIVEAHLKPGSLLSLGKSHLRCEPRSDNLKVALSERDRFGLMVGRSVAMRRVFALLERVATTDTTVLLLGETGTGKDVAAESIHRESGRRDAPFIVVDCGSVPMNLLESELFGHDRGAFTGASGPREGAFEAANGGTVFLDEIGELSLDLQPKLLRVLERREVKRVGANGYKPVDVRVIAATNRSLRAEVNAKRFRSDLYYRLAVVEVHLPALRDRLDDLPSLVEHLAASIPGGEQIAAAGGASFLAELARHAWPGNVRELRNYIERCAALRERSPVDGEPSDDEGHARGLPGMTIDYARPIKIERERWVNAFERAYLAGVLERAGGNVTAAARAAEIDRMHFYRLLWRHGLK